MKAIIAGLMFGILVAFTIHMCITAMQSDQPPTVENTVKLEQPVVTDCGDGKSFEIVSERPVPSRLPEYWLVMIAAGGHDTRPVLVSRGTGNDLPMDFLMPGRMLRVKHIVFGTTGTGQVRVYVGEPVL